VTTPRPTTVEANLRIPSLTLKPLGSEAAQTINNAGNRFTKVLTVEGVPKAGDPLQLTVNAGIVFDCVVTRTDWHDEREMFVVSCSFARRSITNEEYRSLIADPEWTLKQLP